MAGVERRRMGIDRQRATLCAFLLIPCLMSSAAAETPLAPSRPATITRVEQILALTNAQAEEEIPVEVQATVTYVRPSEKNLFVEDGNFGVYVSFAREMGLVPGDRIEVTGKTDSSFRPIVHASQVRFLFHGTMPAPQPATFPDLIRSRWDSRYVEIDGHVLSVAMDGGGPDANLRIKVGVAGGYLEGIIAHPGKLLPENLLDADVRLRGVAGGAFDSKMQMAGVWLDIYSDEGITIMRRPSLDPWSQPISAPSEVVFSYRDSTQSKRAHIRGMLTYYEPGFLAVIERAGQGMLIKTGSFLPLRAGEGIEASGFPAIDGSVLLEDAQLRPVTQADVVVPQKIDWEEASAGHYVFNLVSMEGKVVGVVHDARVDLFVILTGGHLFSASVRRESSDARSGSEIASPPAIGSQVRLTGVCFVEQGDHWRNRLWFELRMRSMADIVLLEKPNWWTVQRLAYLISILGLAVLSAVIWVWQLERRLRAQAALISKQSQEEASRERRLGRQEQQRSHILELISGAEPLPEVLLEIQTMVSTRLDGAHCWFSLIPEIDVGERPTEVEEGNVVSQELLGPSGSSFGFLRVKVGQSKASPVEIGAALLTGARLAELAIDTRRLYSDLRRRSEYDLLTDIPNRFSMERKLKELIVESRRTGASFGLIYIDLDRFKQVNDRYGHQAGDLYLREVTQRMKLQLRGGDVLARIGGDEFIVLVPKLGSRAAAEEISARLAQSFQEVFEVEGHRLHGSASLGLALYPEDGNSQEELQRVADEAMYNNKESRKQEPNSRLAQVQKKMSLVE